MYEERGACPRCGVAEHFEAEACLGCGAWVNPLDLQSGFCAACGADLWLAFCAAARVFARFLSAPARAHLGAALSEDALLDQLREALL